MPHGSLVWKRLWLCLVAPLPVLARGKEGGGALRGVWAFHLQN